MSKFMGEGNSSSSMLASTNAPPFVIQSPLTSMVFLGLGYFLQDEIPFVELA